MSGLTNNTQRLAQGDPIDDGYHASALKHNVISSRVTADRNLMYRGSRCAVALHTLMPLG